MWVCRRTKSPTDRSEEPAAWPTERSAQADGEYPKSTETAGR